MSETLVYPILLRETHAEDGSIRVGIQPLKPMDRSQVGQVAKVARGEGFDLMFEFDREVGVEDVQAQLVSGESISGMPGVLKVWALSDKAIREIPDGLPIESGD